MCGLTREIAAVIASSTLAPSIGDQWKCNQPLKLVNPNSTVSDSSGTQFLQSPQSQH